MIVYDETMIGFDRQISENQEKIASCNRRIKELVDDIADLRQLRLKVERVEEEVEAATGETSRTIDNMQDAVAITSAILKPGFFSKLTEAMKGAEYSKAIEGLSESKRKIDKKIKELEDEISKLNTDIMSYETKIFFLRKQREDYVAQQNAWMRKINESNIENSNNTNNENIQAKNVASTFKKIIDDITKKK